MTTQATLRAAVTPMVLALLAACASEPPVVSRLDSSGLTIVTLDDALVLSRPAHGIAAVVQDYAYVGPVRVNRMGEIDNYLWIGLASTVDREFANEDQAHAIAFVLLIDGQPMLLELEHWEATLDASPYATVAPVYATYGARASLDQIDRIAAATTVEAMFVTERGIAERYRAWQGKWDAWTVFVNAD